MGNAGAENAFCGYVTPQQAIDGWLNSPGHRANLLAERHREMGLGYYLCDSDGRGYVAQMFGADAVYPPVTLKMKQSQPPTQLWVSTSTAASLGCRFVTSFRAVVDQGKVRAGE